MPSQNEPIKPIQQLDGVSFTMRMGQRRLVCRIMNDALRAFAPAASDKELFKIFLLNRDVIEQIALTLYARGRRKPLITRQDLAESCVDLLAVQAGPQRPPGHGSQLTAVSSERAAQWIN